MNKQKRTEKPITWGGYLKFCGVFTVISTIISAVYFIGLVDRVSEDSVEAVQWLGSSKEPFLREKGSLSGGLFLFISTEVVFTKSSSLLRIAVERR